MRDPRYILVMQIPQVLGFVKLEKALELSLLANVITKDEYQAAVGLLGGKCNGASVVDWLASQGLRNNTHGVVEFLKAL